jgi:hypothetical protein
LKKSNFDKFPEVKIDGHNCARDWDNINQIILSQINSWNKEKAVIVIDCYHGVYTDEIISNVKKIVGSGRVFNSNAALLSEEEINSMVYPYVTDDQFLDTLLHYR